MAKCTSKGCPYQAVKGGCHCRKCNADKDLEHSAGWRGNKVPKERTK